MQINIDPPENFKDPQWVVSCYTGCPKKLYSTAYCDSRQAIMEMIDDFLNDKLWDQEKDFS